MIGLEERDTDSGIHVVRLHYSADPNKRSETWKSEAKRGLSDRSWRKEYEVDWRVASGLPVYGEEFVRDWHVGKTELLAYPDREMYRGWDFGLTPACAFGQMDPMARMNLLHEMVTWTGRGDMKQQGIEQLAEAVIIISNRLFPNVKWIDYCDPAGWQKAQTDEKTCVQILHQFDIYPRAGANTFTQRRKAVRDLLCKSAGGRPALLISPTCTMTIEALDGGYRYAEIGETRRFKEDPEKNAWSHIMEAVEYLLSGIYIAPKRDEEARIKRKKRADKVTGY